MKEVSLGAGGRVAVAEMQLWKSRVALALLSVHLQSSWADMGFLSWGALDQDNSSVSGNTLYGGDVSTFNPQTREFLMFCW